MTEDLNLNREAVVEELMKKNVYSNFFLLDSQKNDEAEKDALRRIKQRTGLALNEDANPPLKEFVSQVKNDSSKSGEPSELLWQPTTIQNLMALYPQKTAISDINTVISAANQQPGVPFPLVGPGDKRGEIFVKSDNSGNFYLAHGDKNPKVFVNPAKVSPEDANWDAPGKVSVPVTSSFQKPQINTTDLRHIVASMAEELETLKKEVKSLRETREITESETSKRSLIEKKLSLEQRMESMDDKSKAVIQKLIGAAQQLRTGSANIADSKETTSSTVLTEEVEVKPKAIKVSTTKLHEMLVKTTAKLNSNRTEVLEQLADNISTLIAENLLTNEIASTEFLKETVMSYKKLVG